jgi:hypothetical protein
MKNTLTIILLFYVRLLISQEVDSPQYFQNTFQFDANELKKALDSLALEQLNSNFFKNNLNNFDSNIALKTIDSLSDKKADSIRMSQLFGSYADFQRKFLALDLKNDVLDLNLPKSSRINVFINQQDYAGQVGFSCSGPVSLIYNAFSKEEQSKRKYYALKAYEPTRKRIDAKYNYAKVKRWTGLKDDDLNRFVLYCHFEDSFLINASEYELIQMVLIKLTEFKALADSCNFNN